MLYYQSHNKPFTDLFIKHVEKFIRNLKLFDKEETLYVTCSGGVDSIVLVHFLSELKRFGYSNLINIIHINHGTRKTQNEEQKLVETFGRALNISVSSFLLNGLSGVSNFEQKARELRYAHFRRVAGNKKLMFAHHIDDSFEWSLMQRLKSSNLNSSLGIPVVNGNIVRPFMAVTKEQIRKYADFFKLPYLNDPTNESTKYERNKLRIEVISNISKNYPSFLKHYAYSQEQLAQKLNLAIRSIKNDFQVNYSDQCIEFYSLKKNPDLEYLKNLIKDGIHRLSNKNRGEIQQQLKRAVQAIENNKLGPISFSGGLKLVTHYNHLFLYSKGYQSKDRDYLRVGVNDLSEFKSISLKRFKSIVTQLLSRVELIDYYPLWIIIENFESSWLIGQKRVDPLSPRTTKCWIDQNVKFISALSLLRQWSKQRNSKKVLRLRFLVPVELDLYT